MSDAPKFWRCHVCGGAITGSEAAWIDHVNKCHEQAAWLEHWETSHSDGRPFGLGAPKGNLNED